MGLLDFFRQFSFFRDRDVAELEEDDVNFQKWILAHRDWRRRLVAYIEGGSKEELDENVICRDNQCELGKWIYGHGSKFYNGLPVFHQMVRDHATFHQCAGHVVKIYKTEGSQAARKVLNTDFDTYSLKVVSGLNSLEWEIKE